MIRLIFMGPQRKIIRFEIESKIVNYFDEVWKSGIQIYPKDENIVNRLINSRKGNLRVMAALIIDANKGKNYEEYSLCEKDEDIADFIIKDCRLNGLKQIN